MHRLWPAPEEGPAIFNRDATAFALAVGSELLSAFAEGEDPLA